MDMYQKRKMRKEKREQNEGQNQNGTRTCISWYPGHMAKTKRLITENINLIDVVYEVVDARIPKSSKIKDLDNYIKNKPRIIVLTKYDLCDKKETDKWIKYYEQQGIKTVAMNLENNPNLKPLLNKTNEVMKEKHLKEEEKGLLKRKTRVLVVGVPNAGKSTLINRLVTKKVTNVGNKPGVTKNLNWIRINDEIELLDSPGILWPKIDEDNVAYNLATFTAIKEEILPIESVVNYFVKTMYEYYPNILKERYKLNELDLETVLDVIGSKRGCLVKGGLVDYEKVYTVVINDIKTGAIKGITFDRL